MSKLSLEEIEDRLWRTIDKGRFGMLGLAEANMHFQPMTAFTEKTDGQIWFFINRDSDLARKARDGADAMFVIQAKDQELQACIGGHLVQEHDADRISRYWSPMVAAWFPEGKHDPHLTLLRLECRDAQVWLTEAGPLKFAWEIARSNLKGERPDLGEHRHLDLH